MLVKTHTHTPRLSPNRERPTYRYTEEILLRRSSSELLHTRTSRTVVHCTYVDIIYTLSRTVCGVLHITRGRWVSGVETHKPRSRGFRNRSSLLSLSLSLTPSSKINEREREINLFFFYQKEEGFFSFAGCRVRNSGEGLPTRYLDGSSNFWLFCFYQNVFFVLLLYRENCFFLMKKCLSFFFNFQ